MMSSIDWNRMAEAFHSLNNEWDLGLSHEQERLCLEHLRLVLHWNRTHNLTRITTHRAMLAKHLMDCLVPGRSLDGHHNAIDIGSGPGFPAIPLKIQHPHWSYTLLESNRKKVSFLKIAIARLRLKKTWAVQKRWQEWTPESSFRDRGGFDLITIRAVAVDGEMLERLKSDFLAEGGRIAYWAGPRESTPTMHRDNRADDAFDMEERFYQLPYGAGKRRLLIWRPSTRPL